MQTAREVAALKVDAVKIHNLYVVANTVLAEQVQQGDVELMTLEEYARSASEFLEWLPPGMVVERVCGDAPPDYLVGPAWCQDKSAVLATIDSFLRQRESYQGKKYSSPPTGELDSRANLTAE